MKQSERELDVKECQKSVRSVRRNDVLQARGDAKPARFKRADEHSEDAARGGGGESRRGQRLAGDDVASATAQCRLLQQRGLEALEAAARQGQHHPPIAEEVEPARREEELVRRWQRGRVLRARR